MEWNWRGGRSTRRIKHLCNLKNTTPPVFIMSSCRRHTLFPLYEHSKPSGRQTTTRRQHFHSLRVRILLDENVLPVVTDCANTACATSGFENRKPHRQPCLIVLIANDGCWILAYAIIIIHWNVHFDNYVFVLVIVINCNYIQIFKPINKLLLVRVYTEKL